MLKQRPGPTVRAIPRQFLSTAVSFSALMRLHYQVMPTTAAPCLHVKHHSAEADERQLAARVMRGDPAVLDAVVEKYAQRVIGLAARLLGWADGAEDVAQEVFLQVLRKGKQFRGQSSLWTWLAALTVNRCRSVQRRRWIRERALRMVAMQSREEQTTHEQDLQRDDAAAHIREVVATLPMAAREVIVLRYFEELTIEQMAQVLGLKRNAIEARLSRARKQLEPRLAQWK